MKKITLLLTISLFAMPSLANWTTFSQISYIQRNASGELFVWLAGHSNDNAQTNPGRCDLSIFKVKPGDPGAVFLGDEVQKAFYNNRKVRVNVISSCHNTHRYKRFNNIQIKRPDTG